jgi:putative ABC transport system permease protein
LLVAVVVAVVTLLAGAAPPLLRAVADEAVRAAVRDAAGEADVLAHANWLRDDGYGGRVRDPGLADDVDDLRVRATEVLDPRLRDVLRPPAAVVTSPALNVTDGSLLRTFRLTYLADERGPHSAAVTWIAGTAPAASVPPADLDVTAPYDGPPWPVQVGVSEATAAALALRPGDRIPLADQQRNIKNVQISGIFRPVDGTDPDWRLAPELLGPLTSGRDGANTRLGGLLSPDSLPDARLAFDPDDLVRTIRFAPDPVALASDSAGSVAATLISVKANSGSSAVRDDTLKWESQLDSLLRDVQVRVNAAWAQASVLLIGVLLGAILILVLAADMLVRRRARALTAVRQRGVGLPGVGAELLIESGAVAVAAAAVALAAARVITPGVAWWWAIPVVVAAAVAGPALGTLVAAGGTRDRRAPANPGARRWVRRTRRLRANTAQAALLLVAAAALVALHQRGILQTVPGGALGAWSRPDSGAVLQSSAPALGVLAGTFVLLWPLPWALRAALRQGLRSRHPLVAFGAARATATAARTLPLLAMVTCAGLASFAFTVDATTRQGLVDGAWRTVGADARLDVDPAAALDVPALAGRIAATAGVEQAVAAQIIDGARITTESATVTPRLVVVDSGEFQRLLAAIALPDAPELARLRTPADGAVPALVRSGDGSLPPDARLRLPGQDRPDIELVAVGAAPAVGDAADVVIVDATVLAAAGGPVDPNTIWVRGSATAAAVAAHGAGADAVLRTEVLRDRRTAPLTAGLLLLARASALTLAALGLLGLALGVATTAPQRWLTLSRLRTIGLRAGEARRVTAVELVPPVLLAAVGGPLLGVAVAYLTVGPLALRLLAASQRDPAVTVAWWAVGLLGVAFLAAAAAAVPVEAALRRRLRLSEILRAGDG